MACYNQYRAKTKVTGEIVPIPCGKCIGCRLEKARQWAVRCYHESQMYEQNCFITLTYNEENLPKDRNIEKRELQLFFKRLRKHITEKEIRYYACGEYGTKGNRPHYHACIFNYDFPDKEILYEGQYKHFNNQFSKTHKSNSLYTSKTLQKIWKKGFSTVGEVTFQSAGYVARYIQKKITGEMAKTHYKRDLLEIGSDMRTPEFALMSRGNKKDGKGGIGKPWLEKYFTDVYPKDFFTINGVKNKPPRYYDDLLKKKNPRLHIKIKERRKLLAAEEEIIRLKQKENHKTIITKQLQRNL